MGRELRTVHHVLIPTGTLPHQPGQTGAHTEFSIGLPVYARNYRPTHEEWIDGVMHARREKVLLVVPVGNSTWVRHRNQLRLRHPLASMRGTQQSLPLDVLLGTFTIPAVVRSPVPTTDLCADDRLLRRRWTDRQKSSSSGSVCLPFQRNAGPPPTGIISIVGSNCQTLRTPRPPAPTLAMPLAIVSRSSCPIDPEEQLKSHLMSCPGICTQASFFPLKPCPVLSCPIEKNRNRNLSDTKQSRFTGKTAPIIFIEKQQYLRLLLNGGRPRVSIGHLAAVSFHDFASSNRLFGTTSNEGRQNKSEVQIDPSPTTLLNSRPSFPGSISHSPFPFLEKSSEEIAFKCIYTSCLRLFNKLPEIRQLTHDNPTPHDTQGLSAFHIVRNRCRREIREHTKFVQEKILLRARGNKNFLFKHMRRLRKNKPSAFSLRLSSGETSSDSLVVAEFFREYYSAVYNVASPCWHPVLPLQKFRQPLVTA
ncbi:uncharacterized protein DEA37_0001748 [Paragonimus westermani]|uniref:Uncharacterized protein n=1 Tax=Paragonimus westermani TaxID=34504 RepID=A0A5J4NYK5_9TREM|nr:uncharacterized protein DEA37_0001748 [Paragonimus westermani]